MISKVELIPLERWLVLVGVDIDNDSVMWEYTECDSYIHELVIGRIIFYL